MSRYLVVRLADGDPLDDPSVIACAEWPEDEQEAARSGLGRIFAQLHTFMVQYILSREADRS